MKLSNFNKTLVKLLLLLLLLYIINDLDTKNWREGQSNQCPLDDWLVGSACTANYGGGCTPPETGYHFAGIHQRRERGRGLGEVNQNYACWWHTKNQAWNTSPERSFYSLAQTFGLPTGVGGTSWCFPCNSDPCSTGACVRGPQPASYFNQGRYGAWGWCGGTPFSRGGFVCIPITDEMAARCRGQSRSTCSGQRPARPPPPPPPPVPPPPPPPDSDPNDRAIGIYYKNQAYRG